MKLFAASAWWWVLLAVLAAEAAAAVALAALVKRRLHSAAWRRALWQLTALALLALPLAELWGLGRETARWVNARLEARRPPPAEARPVPVVHRPADFVPLAAPRTRDLVEPAGSLPLVPPPRIEPPGHLARHWPGWLWLIGCGLLLGRAISRREAFRRHRDQHHHEAPVELVKRVAAVAQKLGLAGCVRVIESEHLSGPVAYGLFRPTIGLPAHFAEQFTPAQQDAVLAHELAHLAARDAAWQLLADLATAVWWWHPLAWWTRRQLQNASELAADEASLVVRNGPAALAESLVKLGAQMTEPQLPGGLGVKGFHSGLGRRVERLLRLDGQEWQAPSRWKVLFAKMFGPVVLVMAVVLGSAWAWPQSMLADATPFSQWRQSWREMMAAMSPAAKPTGEGATPRQLVLKIGDQLITLPYQTTPSTPTLKTKDDRRPIDPLKAPDAPPNDPPPPLLHPTLPPKLASGPQTHITEEATVLPKEFSSPRLLHPTLPPKLVPQADKEAGAVGIGSLVQDAKLLYETRLFDQAEEKLKKAIQRDPANQIAYYYMNLVHEARYAGEARTKSPLLHPTLPPKVVTGPQSNLKEWGTNLTVPLPPLLYPTKPLKPVPGANAATGVTEPPFVLICPPTLSAPFLLVSPSGNQQSNTNAWRTVQVEKAWQLPVRRELLPSPNPYVRTNVPNTSSKARQALLAKMDQVHFAELTFDGLPLSEVVMFLAHECRKQDPAKKGLNFIINPFLETASPVRQAAPGTPPPPPRKIDLENVIINIKPPIMDIPLRYALDVICKAADQPIKFIVEDYAIVFTPKQDLPPQRFVRTYKVDPNTFMQGLQSVNGVPLANPTANSQGGRSSITPTVPRVQAAPTGPSQGGLSGVTGTNNLQSISEMARRYFQMAGVNLGTNVSDKAASQIFFNDRTGVLMARATIQDLEIIEHAIALVNRAPLQVALATTLVEIPAGTQNPVLDWPFWTNTASPATPAPATASSAYGILSATQRQSFLQALSKRSDIELKAAPRMVTDSGKTTKVQPDPSTRLDITPTVKIDGFTIELEVALQFPGSSGNVGGKVTTTNATAFLKTTAMVWDGQTMLMGGIVQPRRDGEKRMFMLIEATIVDPAGNRVHTDEELSKLHSTPKQPGTLPAK